MTLNTTLSTIVIELMPLEIHPTTLPLRYTEIPFNYYYFNTPPLTIYLLNKSPKVGFEPTTL